MKRTLILLIALTITGSALLSQSAPTSPYKAPSSSEALRLAIERYGDFYDAPAIVSNTVRYVTAVFASNTFTVSTVSDARTLFTAARVLYLYRAHDEMYSLYKDAAVALQATLASNAFEIDEDSGAKPLLRDAEGMTDETLSALLNELIAMGNALAHTEENETNAQRARAIYDALAEINEAWAHEDALSYSLGLSAYGAEKYYEAIQALKAVDKKSVFAFLPLYLGLSYMNIGMLDDAGYWLSQATKNDSAFSYRYREAVTFIQKGETNKAIEAFLNAETAEPGVPEVYYNLGVLYRDAFDIAKAEFYLKEALKYRPAYPAAAYALAALFLEMELYADAIPYLERVALSLEFDGAGGERGFSLAEVYNDLAYAFAMQPKPNLQKALMYAEQSVDRYKETGAVDPRAYHTLSVVYEKRGNPRAALTAIRDANARLAEIAARDKNDPRLGAINAYREREQALSNIR